VLVHSESNKRTMLTLSYVFARSLINRSESNSRKLLSIRPAVDGTFG